MPHWLCLSASLMLFFALRAARSSMLGLAASPVISTAFAPSASLTIRPPEIGIVDFRHLMGTVTTSA